jgi:flagellar motor switch protein FliG
VAEAQPKTQRSPVERAAILLMSLGEADAAQVLKHMDAKEVQRVGSAMAQLSGVSREEIADIVASFSGELSQQTSVGIDSGDYVRKVLTEALGADKANGIVDRILGARTGRGLDALKWMEPKSVAEVLRREHPQIAAIVMAYLDSDQAASVLTLMPEGMRADLITRIAKLDGVHPTALKELDEVFERQLSGSTGQKAAGLGGPKVAAGIMNLVGASNEAPIFEEINKSDTDLATQIQDLMLVFNDLVDCNDRGMQELLREVPSDKLILALKAADEATKEKFFKNMSERAAETLRDDLANKGPVKLSEVEAAQKEILLTARRLSDEGRIQLGSMGGEAYV